MSEVTYEEEKQDQSILYSRFERASEVPQLEKWILSTGVVSSSETAKYVLLAAAIGAFLLALVLPKMFGHPSTIYDPTDVQKQQLNNMSRSPQYPQ